MKRFLIIIAGWHYYNKSFYENIHKLCKDNDQIDVFISSHKQRSEIDSKIFELIINIPRVRIEVFENVGFDWGMYSQAIEFLSQNVINYKYICFINDNIEIRDLNFLEKFSDFAEENQLIIAGNRINHMNYPWPKTHPHIVEWARLSKWKIDIKSTSWNTVKSRFFMAKSNLFQKIEKIPYKNDNQPNLGNWGMIIFAGLVSDLFGKDSIKAICNGNLTSPYIQEHQRDDGENNQFKYSNQAEKGLKVHIGCGKDYKDGYLNIDSFPYAKADVISNVMDIYFKPNSVSEFVMYHFIEHLNRFEAEKFLSNLYKSLLSNGLLIIECPDVIKVARLVLKNKNNLDNLENGALGLRGFFGEPFENMEIGDYHKWGYSEYTLSKKLKTIGFSLVKIEKPISHGGRNNRDLRVVAIK
jgi:hypothetical protein